ncbi:hypothetical protein [Rhodococcus erythropolis]|uniref:hypothetical protein n=1 Tax=Rhodococcus erythropolis TaxID=1833 RepID=UPI000F736DC0|nr:hypothetical protein [Rhodococcus erythropolis]
MTGLTDLVEIYDFVRETKMPRPEGNEEGTFFVVNRLDFEKWWSDRIIQDFHEIDQCELNQRSSKTETCRIDQHTLD